MNSALQQGKSYICSALLKHGNCSFSLEILEYCEVDKCLIREKHYLDLLEPEYNLSLDPTASFAGRKHSDKSKTIMSDAKKGIQLTEETKRIMSGVRKGKTHSEETKKKISLSMLNSLKIEVFDLQEKTTTAYNSIHEAARALNIHKGVIDMYFSRNQQKPYKGRYTFALKKI